MFIIISTNFDSNLDHFYSLNSFRILRELILYAELIYLNILQICIFGAKISYFFIGLWFELKIVTNESLPQIIDCTFLFSLPSEHYHSPQSISVMKITNFVKSAKTSFSAPLTQKCTRVLRTTLLVHDPPSQDRLEDFSQATTSNSLQSPNGMIGAHKTGFLRKGWTTISSHFSVPDSFSCSWGVTLRGIGWSMSLRRRRTVTCERECHLYLSTKCLEMCICNKFDVSHHFHKFRF